MARTFEEQMKEYFPSGIPSITPEEGGYGWLVPSIEKAVMKYDPREPIGVSTGYPLLPGGQGGAARLLPMETSIATAIAYAQPRAKVTTTDGKAVQKGFFERNAGWILLGAVLAVGGAYIGGKVT